MSHLGDIPPSTIVFGQSQQMDLVRRSIDKVAGTNIPVLIEGECGTGKDILARLIHLKSPWQSGPFVRVNCPAIPGTLLESELFGYEKGAFTGAVTSKPGRVETAARGTLFLDEIAEIDSGLQSKLLQLLQDGQFCPIGAEADRKVDTRIVCATNRDLMREIELGNFRLDLFYRINVVRLQLPPLRRRSSDIPEMVSYFLNLYNEKHNCRTKMPASSVIEQMQLYNWPGNIRQLENLVRRYVLLGTEDVIKAETANTPTDTWDYEIPADGNVPLKKLTRQAVSKIERKIILHVLEKYKWNRKKAAKALSISYRGLLYKIRDAGLPRDSNSFPKE